MSDKTTIVGKDGKPKYVIEGDKVQDLTEHKHDIDGVIELSLPELSRTQKCKICGKSVAEIVKEIEDEHRNT